jgi:L-Ala-D/L-Glu epimerase
MASWSVTIESFPTAGTFTIARGARTEAVVVIATVTDGSFSGRGEATPYKRYGETVEGVADAIRRAQAPLDRDHVRRTVPRGAARNAIDCALLDLEAKRTGHRAHEILGLPVPAALTTAYTLGLELPDEMAAKARAHHDKPLLKVKLGSPDDIARLQAIRQARPDARLIVDANEGWSPDIFPHMMRAAADLRVELIEQPVPAGQDALLAHVPRLVPLCADESVHTINDLAGFVGLYDAINIKLDKTGGLT